MVHAPRLGATVVGRDSIVLGVLLVILEVDTLVLSCVVLDCVVVYRVLPDLIHVLNRRPDHFVQLPTLLLL